MPEWAWQRGNSPRPLQRTELGAPSRFGLGPRVLIAFERSALSPPALSLRSAAASLVTVSLTFDDTEDEQRDAAAVLDAHGLAGTFYVNSPRLHQSRAGGMNVDDFEIAAATED